MFDAVILDHQPDGDLLPAGIENLEPGPELALELSKVDVCRLSGYDRVVVLQAHQKLVSHYSAALLADMAAVYDVYADAMGEGETAGHAAAGEIRAALALTRRAADSDLSLALDVTGRFPQIHAALAEGRIDLRKARTLITGIGSLPDTEAHPIIDQVLGQAQTLTTGQIAALVRRLALEADPDAAERRYQDAIAERRVILEPNPEGTGNLLGLDLPAHRVASAARRINAIARSLRRNGEQRTMDQLRADIYLDLLEGTAQHGNTPVALELRADIETLTRVADQNKTAEIPGFGPVIADIAQQVAETRRLASISYTIDTPDGTHTGVTRRRPTASTTRQVRARYDTCVFPGCRTPAADCDLDHRIPWSHGGPTDIDHLAPTCRHDHHNLRHQAGWNYHRLHNGDHQWLSPLGHTYVVPRRPP